MVKVNDRWLEAEAGILSHNPDGGQVDAGTDLDSPATTSADLCAAYNSAAGTAAVPSAVSATQDLGATL